MILSRNEKKMLKQKKSNFQFVEHSDIHKYTRYHAMGYIERHALRRVCESISF